jgi:hypothetical protein
VADEATQGVNPRKPWLWLVAAFVLAVGIALLETRLREMQSVLLLYFLASFWLAVPRRAPGFGLAAVMIVAPFLVHGLTGTPPNWSALATVGAVILGAAAGSAGGKAFAELDAPVVSPTERVPRFVATTIGGRALLSLALTAFAALGVSPVWAGLRFGGLALGVVRVPAIDVTLVAVRWAQALTLVGWVFLTPLLLRIRRQFGANPPGGTREDGLTVAELARHLGVVALLALAHGGALAAMASIAAQRAPVFFGTSPASGTLWLVISATYAPLDLLTYISILGLAHLTDRARQAEDARRRAVTLEAVAVAARLSALKARLDPHFLYNALNAAVTLARRGQGDDTSRVLEELTALLRYVLDDSRSSVPLAEEIAFVRRYLEIMELRFGARLTFSIGVDGGASDMPVPPLILQPLVENAVEHGVANTTGRVAVRVAARCDGQHLVMTVEDDGPGPNAGSRAGAGMGLGATRERLAMLFGEAASLTLEPRAPRGAVATLALPVMTPAAS